MSNTPTPTRLIDMRMYSVRFVAGCLAAGLITVSAMDAEAQRVRTFDDQAEGAESSESQIAIPGAPAPDPGEQEVEVQQAQPTESEEDSDDTPTGSYQIRVHGATPGSGGEPPRRLSREHTELYRGIIPGQRDEVEHLDKEDLNRLTWIGFQPEDDRTRVFFQAPDTIAYDVQEAFDEKGELVIVFRDAEIGARNFARFIDASHFGRVVERIEAREDGSDIHVVLTMNEAVEPDISAGEGYLYVDFPYEGSSETSNGEDEPRAEAAP